MLLQTALWMIAVAVVVIAVRVGFLWWKYRGDRVVLCPENQRPAGVRLNAMHAASAVIGHGEFRLSACSRWPEKAGCGQECLSQVEASPEGCLVRNILAEWYAGKSCVMCGLPFGEIEWATAKPALLRSGGVAAEWPEIRPEELRATLETSAPVCYACHMADKLVKEHPELVVNRSRPALPRS